MLQFTRALVVGYSLFAGHAIGPARLQSDRNAVAFPLLCEKHADCALPLVCCDGILFAYCCDPGGAHQRLPRVPNATLPFPQVPGPVARPA